MMPNGTSGRVLLADLHRAALEGQGTFRESTPYLRKVGALDESDPLKPHVLLPNYVYSPSNCLGTTSFFDVCCPNECDEIMEHLEKRLETPEAAPVDIVSALAVLPGGIAGSALPPQTLARLDELARLHRGRVPLHGHSFADWLHFAFPQECPRSRVEDFTHSSGSGAAAPPSGTAEEADEVPGTEREYQEAAGLTSSMAAMAATPEELLLEAKALAGAGINASAVKPEGELDAAVAKRLLTAGVPGLGAGLGPSGFDVTSFAQTGVQARPSSLKVGSAKPAEKQE
jgi:hypothetical protein